MRERNAQGGRRSVPPDALGATAPNPATIASVVAIREPCADGTPRGRRHLSAAIATRSRRQVPAAPLPLVGQSGKSRVCDTALISLSAGAVSALQGGACCYATLPQQTPPFRNRAINTLNKLASDQTGIGHPAARGGFAHRPSAIPTTTSLKRRAASLGLPPQTPPLVRGSRPREVSGEPALARGSCPLENPRTRPRRPNGACSPVP